ncbi:hypothetical protein GALMADRAFT_53752 [Galerina marginata CBS 339.88]|uniref:F-box domain-containing protein n=1 Tax=Galerina marginata (strain CBS 339.88) TaxID=685588 RepID=A0A067U2N3_GALM3|nr:hypothetical protein GALMADRAFT_53752 [Galerina marginata CBS 339.88]
MRQSPVASSSLQSQIPGPAAVALPKAMPSHDDSFTSVGLESGNEGVIQPVVGKGKEKTMPMPIRPSRIIHDLFDVSPQSTSSVTNYGVFEHSSPSMTFSPTSSNFSSSDFDNRYRHHNLSLDSMEQLESSSHMLLPDSPSGKGKEKEPFPYLPPLTFSVIKLDYSHDHDLPPTPGPSSYGTLYSPPLAIDSLPPIFNDREIPVPPSHSPSPEPDSQDLTEPHLTRCRSLANLSQPISALLGTVSTTTNPQQSTFGPSRIPNNISHQIIDQKDYNNDSSSLDQTRQASGPSSAISKFDLLAIQREPGSYPPSWYTVAKPVGSMLTAQAFIHSPAPRPSLRTKVRSKSSPYPISVLDFIPNTSPDIFQPLPIVIPNYFDLILPKELRLHILGALLESHEQDYLRYVRDGRLSVAKASSSRGRWVGKDKGVRELVKLSRVSKGWQALVFDGELWKNVDLRSFHSLPPAFVARLIQSAGTFVRKLNFAGHVQITPDTMLEITNSLCLPVPQAPLSYTQITSVNFQGCISLTTRSLHHFLVRSRSLETLSVKGLAAVTNTTCDIVANFCPRLASLNLSRCTNLDGQGIGALTVSAILRKEHLLLKELRVSGLKHVTDGIMQALGRAAPYLEVLDLSYSRHLHNSAIEAFVACEGQTDHQLAIDTVLVSPRDLGRETNDGYKLKRRVTPLRHLVLSSCVLLTDVACSNLAHSVPKLEFLELAGIGADLKDSGLIRLLSTTPHIRRLDFEDASDITDALLAAITPAPDGLINISSAQPPAKQTGYALQQLNISYAGQITDEAFLSLIRNCPQLTVLEADNTRMGTAVLKEFVRVSRQRKAKDARVVAIDCRGIHESLVKELSPMTRPRLGWRAYGARKLSYLDARDDNEEDLKIGQDECDEERVVLKTFYSWQTVDAVKVAREKRRKATGRRTASDSSMASAHDEFEAVQVGRSARWWSPGGRRSPRSGGQDRNSPPIIPDLNNDGCRMM